MAAIPPEKRAAIAQAIRDGGTRNKIAAEFGVSWPTVTRIARENGLKFDRAAPKAAIEAAKIDHRARRYELAGQLLDKAQEFLTAMDAPFLAFNFGGKENTYNEHMLHRPPTGDIRNLMVSTGIALQRHLDLEKHDADPGLDAAMGMLTQLGEAFGAAYRQLEPADES